MCVKSHIEYLLYKFWVYKILQGTVIATKLVILEYNIDVANVFSQIITNGIEGNLITTC